MLSYSVRDRYWCAFRRKSHRLLHLGYSEALPKIRRHSPEENISGIIEENCQNLLDRGLCFDPEFRDVRVKNEKPINGGKRFGKDRFKIDIIIHEPHQNKPPAVFAFEAKRLRTGTHGIGKYVGSEGVGCFLRGDYVTEMPEAAMIGYIQNQETAYWKDQLEVKLDQTIKPIKIIPEIQNEWISQHPRNTGNPISLYHIFLDCRPGEDV